MRGVGNRGGARAGVFQRTLRDTPRFSDVQRRIVAVGFGSTGVERRTKINAQSHGMR